MRKLIAAVSALGLAGPLALALAPAQAADYPDKPIRLITPFPPGGGTDAVARIVGDKLAELLGQAVVVDNKGGAGGSLGTEQAARAAPDGYTLVLGSSATHAVNPSLYSKLGYDPIADFAPVSPVASTPLLLMVSPSMQVKNVAELIALAKTKPAGAGLSYASAGPGSAQHLGGELFKTMSGANLLHVPYKGAGPAMADVLAGHVDMMFDTMPSALPQLRSGKLRVLGISSAARNAGLPDVPAIAEAVPGYELVTWYGLFAPKGTPPAIVERLNREVQRVLASKEVQEKFKTAGIDVNWSSSADFSALVKREVPKWRKVIQQSGAKVD
ncbi:tripartite tricarboxylate transporter substrate binding protein [Variovorax sp. LjRoot84]|uniref:Bug family tripartite tricarboxylate transporter substrate binding protein n=1 Tax=unclassified Variovorax TaxID=663243 RepID=UPI003ECFB744